MLSEKYPIAKSCMLYDFMYITQLWRWRKDEWLPGVRDRGGLGRAGREAGTDVNREG